MRCACTDEARAKRRSREVAADALRGKPLEIDGYNALTTIEAALSGGVILKGRDGCFRDMASMHGTYRKVAETVPALEMVGRVLEELGGVMKLSALCGLGQTAPVPVLDTLKYFRKDYENRISQSVFLRSLRTVKG